MQQNKCAWIYVNDKLLKYCEFYTESSIEHRIESTQIFIKKKSHHVKVKIQLEIKPRHINSSWLRKSLASFAAPSFASWLLPNFWPWLGKTFFLKDCIWFDPMFQRIEILIVNTLAIYHRGDMMNEQDILMRCMTYVFMRLTWDARKTMCWGTMFTWFFYHFQERGVYNPHNLFIAITIVPNTSNQ